MKAVLLSALALTACVQPAAAPPTGELMDCDGAKVQRFVGKPYTEALGREAMAASGSSTLRVTRPGQAVTMDYRTDRLNIDLDERDVVQRVSCG